MAKVISELNCPVVLMFDEANVIGRNRVLLEKIRNIFMNILGYMLVFVGTPELFPLMDDVFSPIVRQFKKIMVGGFLDISDTEKCIRSPIESIGLSVDELFNFKAPLRFNEDVIEIHRLSGGRPYEIQLISHFLFRRIQEKRADKMKLDLSVLEDVRKQLETSQDITTRPILNKIPNLDSKKLLALGFLCSCDGSATFEQIWVLEYIINNNKYFKKKSLHNDLEYFAKNEIVDISEDIIKFNGDEFDRIYAKYLASERKIDLFISKTPLHIHWIIKLGKLLGESINLAIITIPFKMQEGFDFNSFAEKMKSVTKENDVYVENEYLSVRLYELMYWYKNIDFVPILIIQIKSPWLNQSDLLCIRDSKNLKPIKKILQITKPMIQRANKVNASLSINRRDVQVMALEELKQNVMKTSNEQVRLGLANFHYEEAIEQYISKKNRNESISNAYISYEYNPKQNNRHSNNLGYIFMVNGDLKKSRLLFEAIITQSKNEKEAFGAALPNFNLGIIDLKEGNFTEGLKNIELSITLLRNKRSNYDCLTVPRTVNKKLTFTEVWDVDLLKVATEAKSIISKLV